MAKRLSADAYNGGVRSRRKRNFFSQCDCKYVGCHWLRFAPFLCTNFVGQGPESLATSAAKKSAGIAEPECAKLKLYWLLGLNL